MSPQPRKMTKVMKVELVGLRHEIHLHLISSSCVFCYIFFLQLLYVHMFCGDDMYFSFSKNDKSKAERGSFSTQNLGIHTHDGVFHVGCHRILCSLIFLSDITSPTAGHDVRKRDPTTCYVPNCSRILCLLFLSTLMPESRDSLVMSCII